MMDWFVYWFMLPACLLIASFAMLTGISGTAMLTPFLILVFPVINVPVLTPAQAVGMALFTEFFGFSSGVVGYHKERLIDYQTARRLLLVSIPAIVVFSLMANLVSSLLLRGAYGGMMIFLAAYLFLGSASSARNRQLREPPRAAALIPRRNEGPTERVVISKRHGEFRYKVCDQKSGLLACGTGAAMEGLVSVGLGELLMPNLVKRCKIPVAVSAATSVFVIAVTVFAGSVTSVLALVQKGGLGAAPWNLVLYTIPGAVIGGQIGSRFQGALSSEAMEKLIAALFLVIGLAFITTLMLAIMA